MEKELLTIIEEVERLKEARKNINLDINQVIASAKFAGFEVKAIKELLRYRESNRQEFEETREIFDMYKDRIEELEKFKASTENFIKGVKIEVDEAPENSNEWDF